PITNQYSIPQRYDAIAHHHVRSGQELMGMKNWPENTPKTRYMVVGLAFTLLAALWLIFKIVR
ncbi:MAG TPA: hypothetical protein VFN53_04595, partial [Acidobacteriaceae bacterium]|nr:hypothetical protein [Acidobacteriaceae bacterium]